MAMPCCYSLLGAFDYFLCKNWSMRFLFLHSVTTLTRTTGDESFFSAACRGPSAAMVEWGNQIKSLRLRVTAAVHMFID